MGESLLKQLRSTEATGRLVIDIDRMKGIKAGSAVDVTLKAGDRLLVPKRSQSVTVLGEVQYSTSHIFHNSFPIGELSCSSLDFFGEITGRNFRNS